MVKLKNPFKRNKKTLEEKEAERAAKEDLKVQKKAEKEARKLAKAELKAQKKAEKQESKSIDKKISIISDQSKKSKVKGELDNGSIIKSINTAIKLASEIKKDNSEKISKFRSAKIILGNAPGLFSTTKAGLKLFTLIKKETSLKNDDLKKIPEDKTVTTKIMESKAIKGLLADPNLWEALKLQSPRIGKILQNYKNEIIPALRDVAKKDNEQLPVEIRPALGLLISGLSSPNSAAAVAEILRDNTAEIQNLFNDNEIDKNLKERGISSKLVQEFIPALGQIIPELAKDQEAIGKFIEDITPSLSKIFPSIESGKGADLSALSSSDFAYIAKKASFLADIINLDGVIDILFKHETIVSRTINELGIDQNELKNSIPTIIGSLSNIAGHSDALEDLISNISPILEKTQKAEEERALGNYNSEYDLSGFEIQNLILSVYNFANVTDISSEISSLSNNDSVLKLISSLVPKQFDASPELKKEGIRLGFQFFSLLTNTTNLEANTEVFSNSIQVILDESVKPKERLDKIFKTVDIFVSQIKSEEGKKIIKEDLKTYIQTHKDELRKLGDAFVEGDPKIAKLGIKTDRVLEALTKDGMYEDIIKLYEYFKEDRKLALTGKGLKLFATNKDARVLAFTVVKNLIVSFFRDSVYPAFLKNVLVNNTCHSALTEVVSEARNSNEKINLNKELKEIAGSRFSFKGYALRYAEFGKLDLRGIEFENLEIDHMNLSNTLVGSSNGLVMRNCTIKSCDLSFKFIRQGNIDLSNSTISAESLLTLTDSLVFAENHKYKINLDGLKITDVKSLKVDEINKLKECSAIKEVLEGQLKAASKGRKL